MILATWLLARFGSKNMLSCGLITVVVAMTLLTVSTTLKSSIPGASTLGVVGVALFFVGTGAGPMLAMVAYPSEMTTTVTRPNAMWLGGAGFWTTGALVSFIFPYSLAAIGGYAYIPFTILTALAVSSLAYFLVRNLYTY